MSVEEYETVYQLVSVIEGELDERKSGTAVLAASLPPGSMTGAPKKRSCEILKEIEQRKPRGPYSGVMGYFDVGGGGDFSVIIRSAYKWDDEDSDWHIGAGGAVTVLSSAEGEWQEMLTKRDSLLPTFLQ
jgi:para-aminobenzoate synthetase